MGFAKISLFTIAVLLLLYFGWWLYVLYFLYYKEYDNGYAAATASIGVTAITAILLAAYTIFFLLEAKGSRENRRFYLRITLLLFAPVVGISLCEAIRALLAR